MGYRTVAEQNSEDYRRASADTAEIARWSYHVAWWPGSELNGGLGRK